MHHHEKRLNLREEKKKHSRDIRHKFPFTLQLKNVHIFNSFSPFFRSFIRLSFPDLFNAALLSDCGMPLQKFPAKLLVSHYGAFIQFRFPSPPPKIYEQRTLNFTSRAKPETL